MVPVTHTTSAVDLAGRMHWELGVTLCPRRWSNRLQEGFVGWLDPCGSRYVRKVTIYHSDQFPTRSTPTNPLLQLVNAFLVDGSSFLKKKK